MNEFEQSAINELKRLTRKMANETKAMAWGKIEFTADPSREAREGHEYIRFMMHGLEMDTSLCENTLWELDKACSAELAKNANSEEIESLNKRKEELEKEMASIEEKLDELQGS
jgi:hypothetical protein